MSQLVFQILIFIYLSFSVVIGLFVCLIRHREDLSYIQVILFLLSPLLIANGIFFIKPLKRKEYFKNLKEKLFLN